MTIIGGVGTLSGPLLGAAIVRLLDHWLDSELLRVALPTWLRTDLLFGLIYVALVLFFPAGIIGAINRLGGTRSVRTLQIFRRAWSPRHVDVERREL
jgi:branched-chain amino acid transport system permease protein